MVKKIVNVGLLGLGTVGTGVARILQDNAENITAKVGGPIRIRKVLVKDLHKSRRVQIADAQFTTDVGEIISDPDIDIIVELIGGEHPAKEYILQALNAGKHVVTANKDVLSKYGKELFAAAEEKSVDLLFEASVAGGIPIIRPLKQCLASNRISEVIGIINGTTNYMLTKMTQERLAYQTVLSEAQEKGYAESNPSADVDGIDAARKISILASIAFGSRVTVNDVYVEGITNIAPDDIEHADELGYVIKLLGVAKEHDGQIEVRVHPAFLPKEHPLAAVHDVFNAIYVKGDAVGETMFYGRGAGEMPTASAVTADILDVARDIHQGVVSQLLCTCYQHKPIKSVYEFASPFYVRMLVSDRPGVLAMIAGAFGAQSVSLHSVIQKHKVNTWAELIVVTETVSEKNMRQALAALRNMLEVNEISNVIRVEGGDLL